LVIGICWGRPSLVPNSVADVACKLPHVTRNATAVPAVTVDGLAKATALPGGVVIAADADADMSNGLASTAAATTRPTAAEPARPRATMRVAANRLIGRMNVPPPKTA
jgi:hypothetical protein